MPGGETPESRGEMPRVRGCPGSRARPAATGSPLRGLRSARSDTQAALRRRRCVLLLAYFVYK